MKEILKVLYKLQAVDLEISALRQTLKQIPIKEEQSNRKIKTEEDAVQEIKIALEKIELRNTKREREKQETSMNLVKHRTQLLAAKTNREYSALLREIDAEEKKIEDIEEESVREVMEIEELSKSLEEKSEDLKETKQKENIEKEKLKAEEEELQSLLSEKMRAREEVITPLTPSHLITYERIRKGRGNAVSLVKEDNMCMGCHTILPAQFVTVIRKGTKLYTCEGCGRILIWYEDVE